MSYSESDLDEIQEYLYKELNLHAYNHSYPKIERILKMLSCLVTEKRIKLSKEDRKILWNRKLSCGHDRRTNIAYMCGKYDRPLVGGDCFCRECNIDVDIVGVSEVKKDMKYEKEKN